MLQIYTNPDNDDNWMFDIGKEYGLQWNQDSLKFEKVMVPRIHPQVHIDLGFRAGRETMHLYGPYHAA